MVALEFDPGVAAKLEAECSKAAEALSKRAESADSQGVFQTFQGPYADQFKSILGQESLDRCGLIGELRNLQEQVAQARVSAAREEQRLANLAKEDEIGRGMQHSVLGPVNPYRPVRGPYLSAFFPVGRRERLATQCSGSGTVSADPNVLDGYVSKIRRVDAGLRDVFSGLAGAWGAFQGACAWVDTSGVTIFGYGSLDLYLEENSLDATWLSTISKAFKQAGGSGTLSTLTVTAAVAKGNDVLAVQALNNPNLSEDEVIELLGLLAKDPSLAKTVATYVNGYLQRITENSEAREFAHAAKLLEAISVSDSACGELVSQIGGDRLIDLVSVAGFQVLNLMVPEPAQFATGLRNVFGKGITWLEKNPGSLGESRVRGVAERIVQRLRDPGRDAVVAGGNDAYALSFLLRCDQVLPSEFLLQLGDRLEAFERSFSEHRFTWRAKGAMARGIGALFNDEDVEAAFDPMAAYMGALGKNPRAALAFFTGDKGLEYELSEDAAKERQQYWIERRLWSHDKFTGLLAALDAAVASFSTAADERAAMLVSKMVLYMASRADGVDLQKNKIGFPLDEEKILPGNLSKQATLNLAHILTTHMAAIDFYLTQNQCSRDKHELDYEQPIVAARFQNFFKAKSEFHGNFFSNDIRKLLKVVLSDEDGVLALRQGITAYHQLEFARIASLQSDKVVYTKALKEAIVSHAKLNAECMKLLGEMKIEGARARDAWVDVSIELSRQLADTGVAAASTAFFQAAAPATVVLCSVGLDKFEQDAKEAFANNAEQVTADQNEAAELFKQQNMIEVLHLLRKTGQLTDGMIKDSAKEYPDLCDRAIAWLDHLGEKGKTSFQVDNVIFNMIQDMPGFKDYDKEYMDVFKKYF